MTTVFTNKIFLQYRTFVYEIDDFSSYTMADDAVDYLPNTGEDYEYTCFWKTFDTRQNDISQSDLDYIISTIENVELEQCKLLSHVSIKIKGFYWRGEDWSEIKDLLVLPF